MNISRPGTLLKVLSDNFQCLTVHILLAQTPKDNKQTKPASGPTLLICAAQLVSCTLQLQIEVGSYSGL